MVWSAAAEEEEEEEGDKLAADSLSPLSRRFPSRQQVAGSESITRRHRSVSALKI